MANDRGVRPNQPTQSPRPNSPESPKASQVYPDMPPTVERRVVEIFGPALAAAAREIAEEERLGQLVPI